MRIETQKKWRTLIKQHADSDLSIGQFCKDKRISQAGMAQWAITHIQKLYRIEKLIEGKSADEKVAIRREQALPLLELFRTWLFR